MDIVCQISERSEEYYNIDDKKYVTIRNIWDHGSRVLIEFDGVKFQVDADELISAVMRCKTGALGY